MNLSKIYRPLYWILLRPSAWRAQIVEVDTALVPEFCLLQLNVSHWRNPQLRRLLLAGYIGLPSTLFVAILLVLSFLNLPTVGTLTAFAFAIVVGLTYGLVVSAAAGMAIIAVVGLINGLLWVDSTTLFIDLIITPRYAGLFGLSNALTIVVMTNLTRQSRQDFMVKQIGGVVLGLIASAVVTGLVIFLVSTIITARQTGKLPGGSVAFVLALAPTLLLGFAVFLQTRCWWKPLLFAVLIALVFVYSFGAIGSEYALEFGGWTLLVGMNSVTLSTFFILSILPFALASRFVGPWPGAVSAAIGGMAIYVACEAIFSVFAFWENIIWAIALMIGGLAFDWLWSGAVYLIEAGWNTLLWQLDSQRVGALRAAGQVRWLRYHAVFWDEIQRIPFFELDDYLVLAVEQSNAFPTPTSVGGVVRSSSTQYNLEQGAPMQNGDATIEAHILRSCNGRAPASLGQELPESLFARVSHSHQQWAAQAAQIELDARRLEKLESVDALASVRSDAAAGLLATPAGLMLRNFTQLGGDIAAALAQPSRYNQGLVMKSVARDLENLQRELARTGKEWLAFRFGRVAQHWHHVVTTHIEMLDAAAHANREIPNPYVVGVPLTRRQEIFVGRTDVARYVEEILRMGDHPPVLLYGPRRMGKTSLLYQLNWMLPHRILPLVVDLQGPVSLASSNIGFLHALARGIRLAAAKSELVLPKLTREELAKEPFTIFDEWLDQVSDTLRSAGREVLLLALDEFEALDNALTSGTLEEHEVLGMLRHIVQHRRGVKLLLSGSHTLDEFRRWSSYLINAQVVELGPLEDAEARRLIETPIDNFPLRYDENALRYTLHLTSGHPYLVQLLCMEIVALKNRHQDEQRVLATIADVEAAVPAMLVRGQQFFADIELNQIDEHGRALLSWLANQGAGYSAAEPELVNVVPSSKIEETLRNLVLRRLLEKRGDSFYFHVEAIRRWFATE